MGMGSPIDRPAASTPRTDAAWCAAGAAVMVAYAIWAAGAIAGAWSAGPRVTSAMNGASTVALYAIAAVLQWRASRSPNLDAVTRSGWRLLSFANLGAFALSGASVVRAALGMTGAPGHARMIVEMVTFGVMNATVLAAIVRFPVSPKLRADRATFWLDAGTVGVATLLAAWHLLFRHELQHAPGGFAKVAGALVYPASDVLLLFASLALLVRRPLRSSASALRVFVLATAISAVGDVPVVFRMLSGGTAATLYQLLFIVAGWLYGLSAYVQSREAGRDAARPVAARTEPPSYSLVPYGAVGAVLALLVVHAAAVAHGAIGADDRAELLTLVAGAVVVTACVVARQVIVLRRNAQLVGDRLAREAYLRAVAERSSDMLVVLERDGRIREASPAFARAVDADAAALRGTPFIDCIDDEDRTTAGADLAAVADAHADAPPFEWRLRADRGVERWVEVVCTNLLDDGVVAAIVLNGRDVSERKQLERELTHRADHDPLTGAANRRAFAAHVALALGRARGTGSARFAVLYADLDGFKPINDAHGHAAGDMVLIAVAERLRAATRGSDLVARLGGDEFAVYLEGADSPSHVEHVVARVLAALDRPIRVEGGEVRVGASLGIAFAPRTPIDPADEGAHRAAEALLREADAAMYAAKKAGGGRPVFAEAPSGA